MDDDLAIFRWMGYFILLVTVLFFIDYQLTQNRLAHCIESHPAEECKELFESAISENTK